MSRAVLVHPQNEARAREVFPGLPIVVSEFVPEGEDAFVFDPAVFSRAAADMVVTLQSWQGPMHRFITDTRRLLEASEPLEPLEWHTADESRVLFDEVSYESGLYLDTCWSCFDPVPRDDDLGLCDRCKAHLRAAVEP